MIEFTFLGTSSGVPTALRNVSGLVLKKDNEKSWFLVDCGEGTQQQLAKTPFSLVKLKAIFITHVHGDHCYGLPGLLASATMAGRKEPLDVIAPKGIEAFVRQTMLHTDVYMAYELNFIPVETLKNYASDTFSISAHELSHRVPCYAYKFVEDVCLRKLDTKKLIAANIPQGPIWGKIAKEDSVELDDGTRVNSKDYYLAPDKPQAVIIGGDNDTPSILKNTIEGVDVLVHEATYTDEVSQKVGPGPQHSSAKIVAEFAESVKLKNLVLTHFSARYHHPDPESRSSIYDISEEAKKYYSSNLFIAEDFDNYCLQKNGELKKIV